MSKTLSLTIGERVAGIRLLNEGKFNNATLAIVLDDIKKLAVTPENWEEAKLVKSPTDEELAAMAPQQREKAAQTWTWDETILKDVELGQETVDFLHGEVTRRGEAKELTLADAALLALDKKLTQ